MPFWTKEQLCQAVTKNLHGSKLIVVSNREPYIHVNTEQGIHCKRPASGMAAALDPILRTSGGVWIAHGSGDADMATVDRHDRVAVPPEEPAYTLRRVWLPKKLEEEYYHGLSNEGLWPLCHVAFQRPTFVERHWESYHAANRLFADAVLQEAAGQPAVVFVQDYHLGLLPRMLKNADPTLVVAQFWHIPWPNWEAMRVFPWNRELLESMLCNDVLGFHLHSDCENFLATVDRNVNAVVDQSRLSAVRNGHTTHVRAFPISIDFDAHSSKAQTPEILQHTGSWLRRIGPTEFLGVGVDRVDYTKGLPEKFRGIDCLLERHPEYIGRLRFIQIGAPSRTSITDYSRLNNEVFQLADAVNRRWQRGDWRPLELIQEHVDMPALMALHRMADFCLVNSLHDGMNLVAKEFVASRSDERGTLILSRFAGASRELTSALLINPFSALEIATAVNRAIRMDGEEQRRRMRKMRETVRTNNIYRWAGNIVQELSQKRVADDIPQELQVDAA